MKGVDLLLLGREMLKMMSSADIKRDDWRYIRLYEEYTAMRECGEKFHYAIVVLSEKYYG